jgi:hypothetical protein
MGGWQLEVFKMASYVSLPIVCFYLFNKPEYFKEILTETRQYYFTQEDPKAVCILIYFYCQNLFILYIYFFKKISQLEAYKKEKEQENEKKILEQIEAFRKKQK